MKGNHLKILLSPFFLLGLFLLLLNDFYLKAEFHNFCTGKLSDFAGLFIFPMFWSAFFPKRTLEIYLSTAIFFVFWKSPSSEYLIEFVNSLNLLNLGRVVDYTDLWALAVLPLSYWLFNLSAISGNDILFLRLNHKFYLVFTIFLSVFAFTATSYDPYGRVDFDKTYQTRMKRQDIEKILQDKKDNDAYFYFHIKKDEYSLSANNGFNNKIVYEKFDVNLFIKHQICDSVGVTYDFVLTQEDNFSTIGNISAKYECDSNPGNFSALQNEQSNELINVFEREIIDKLQLMPEPKIINNNE